MNECMSLGVWYDNVNLYINLQQLWQKITNVSQIVETNDCTFQVIVFAKPSEQPIDNMTISHAKTR